VFKKEERLREYFLCIGEVIMKPPSTIAKKYPTFRDSIFKNSHKWLDGKRIDDNAEGLWRVHDKLYDLSDFIERHPGGKDWISLTKGIDITEQFETHHITEKAEQLLKKYYIRDAVEPRNYKITFDNNGFYMTLKKRVASKLPSILEKSSATNSQFYCDLMLSSTILSFVLVARNYTLLNTFICALSLLALTIISHNFIHQRDNWRMYLVNFSTQNYREWRSKFN
jgi:hypothetical protein